MSAPVSRRGVVQGPAEVVVQRHAPAQHPGVAGAVEHVEALGGPLLFVPGVVEREHVQRVEHEERRPRERRLAHAAGELGHGVAGPAIGCRDAASFDRHACPQLGRERRGVARCHPGRGDGVEQRQRLVGAPLDAERTGELGRQHGTQVRAVRVVVGGLAEPLLARLSDR